MLNAVLLIILALAPTTDPTTRPTVEEDLRRIIRGLRDQITELKTQNTALKEEITKRDEEIKELLEKIPKSLPADTKIQIGMTVEQVSALAGSPGELMTDNGGEKIYEWTTSRAIVEGMRERGSFILTGVFRDGKLIRYTKTPR